DCDDLNPEINPDAEEIPYNYIDENCDGFDLADVDKDGFCLSGYIIDDAGLQCPNETTDIGTDCNDSDASINPGSGDVYKNCINDAPIIEPIDKITVYETEIVEIIVNATDPEGDEIFYSINDTRFSQNENIFSWQTGYDDYGNYFFTITASDGNLSSEIKVEVEVKNTNQVPVCNEIPPLEWQEDNVASLNLSDYCYDPDGDVLGFYFHNTSEDKYISLESLDSETGIANFSSEQDWYGDDWIIFKVYDGKDYNFTNKIILNVTPVNDAPVFTGKIENITWNEDTNLINYIDLNQYFSDIDSEIIFNVTGNHFINITINEGLVSFYPDKDWHGTENIFFSASDEEFTINSNAIALSVLDVNEPPEFEEMNCEAEILEDVLYSCELNASDFEGDDLSFSVINENNLDCEIEDNILNYVSYKDYFGEASCLIRVSDDYSYTEYLLEVNVTPVNDPPVIKDYSPKGAVRLIENTNELFSVIAFDVEDDDLNISWFLDDELAGIGGSYLFNQEEGSYELKVEVSDGIENTIKTWDIFVGTTEDFTCEELGGYICSEKEICREDFWQTLDTERCCPIKCEPAFSDVKRCENLSEKIEIKIKKPNEDDEFIVGESIKGKLKVKNNFEEDLDFDVEVYLYDITEDSEIKEYEDSIDIDKDDSKKIEFEFEIPEDLDASHKYAIFVKVLEEDERYCNENYKKINIEREKHDVVIEEIKIEPKTAVCGDYIHIKTKIKNLGTKDEDVYVIIKNPDLEIYEKTKKFEIEKFGEKDEVSREFFNIKIPEDANAGNYSITISLFFNNKEISTKDELILGECKNVETKISEIERISLKGEEKEIKMQKAKTQNKKLITSFISIIAILIIFLIIISFSFRKP
ncbi:MAG: tandem-95 repeat protein, partial [Promethearchaeota archaeon]